MLRASATAFLFSPSGQKPGAPCLPFTQQQHKHRTEDQHEHQQLKRAAGPSLRLVVCRPTDTRKVQHGEHITVHCAGERNCRAEGVEPRDFRRRGEAGEPKRIDGSNITEAFKETLPVNWTKSKLDLVVEAIKSASDEDREAYGLVCQPSIEWKVVNE